MLTKQTANECRSILIWDLPTRVFHWLLATMFALAWLSHDDGRYLDVHTFAGYTFLGLLLFRLIWGVCGSHHARFRQFSYSPAQAIAYVKGLIGTHPRRYLGHNPAGAWAIFALLGAGLVVTVSGLFVLGGEERHGPLAGVISFDQSVGFRLAHEVAAYGLLALVAVHLFGVISASVFHRENLIGAMFRGSKRADTQSPAVRPHRPVAAILLGLVAVHLVTAFGGYLNATPEQPYLPFEGPALAKHETWETVCGECHLAFHPSLLPARSWRLMLAQQADHFGDDLMLEDDTVAALLDYATAHAADREQTEAAWRLNNAIAAHDAPLRITKVDYWVAKHRPLGEQVWQRDAVKHRSNCAACHLDAGLGRFADANMRIPGGAGFDPRAWLQSVLGQDSG